MKYRQKVFVDDLCIIEDLKEIVDKISKVFNVEVLEIECGIDHVHLVISTHPNLIIPKI